MTVPAGARVFLWDIGRRHRLGLIAVAAYASLLAGLRLSSAAWGQAVDDPGVLRFVGLVSVPLSAAAFYLLAVFSFGFAGDLAARQSMYPARLLALPISTTALVAWPMAYGTASIVTLVLAARLASWPRGIEPPLWTALFAAVVLAWIQALTWTAYPLRGLRVAAAVAVLVVMDVAVVVAFELKTPPSWMFAILTPLLPLAYLAARAAVVRARRGDVPDWSGVRAALAHPGGRRRRRAFRSPLEAQAWCEWRDYGLSLPVWIAIAVPIESAAFFVDDRSEVLFWIKLVVVLLTPPLTASFVAARVRTASAPGRDVEGLPPFLATRPLASTTIVAAKLRTAAWSTAFAWLVLLLVVVPALHLSGTWPLLAERVGRLRDVVGAPRTIAFIALVLSLLMGATWKRMVLSLQIGLSGRPWLIRAHVGLTLAILTALIPLAQWLTRSREQVIATWEALPWILGAVVVVKLALAMLVLARLNRDRLRPDRAIVRDAAIWAGTVFGLYVVLVWMLWTPHIPRHLLMLFAILFTPLTRLSAAPLALAWNRHQ